MSCCYFLHDLTNVLYGMVTNGYNLLLFYLNTRHYLLPDKLDDIIKEEKKRGICKCKFYI